jgi:predicted secreted protein
VLRKRTLIAVFIAILTGLSAYAGDVANFKDLGFSSDGTIYMFGEYGVTGTDLKPWARMYIVNVTSNDFVPGGRLTYQHDSKIVAGTDGEGALFAIVAQNPEITGRYNFNFLEQGLPLYVTLKNSPQASGGVNTETISFRDFDRKTSYTITLRSLVEGSGANVSSSFYLTIERKNANGSTDTFQVGSPGVKRNVSSYSIKKVTFKPDTKSMAFIIEMRSPPSSEGGSDIHYMVETWKQ